MVEQVTPVPNAPHVRRGRRVFAWPGRPGDQPARAFRLRADGDRSARRGCWSCRAGPRSVGLLADEAREFVAIPDASIQPPGEAIGGLSGNYLDGVATLGERIVLILDIARGRGEHSDRGGLMRITADTEKENGHGSQRSSATERVRSRSHGFCAKRPTTITDAVVAHREDHRPGVRRAPTPRSRSLDTALSGLNQMTASLKETAARPNRSPTRPTAWSRRSTRWPPRSSRSRRTSAEPGRFIRQTAASIQQSNASIQKVTAHRAGDGDSRRSRSRRR